MNKEVKELKEYIESPFSARGGISYEQMQLIFDYINQLETNWNELKKWLENHWEQSQDIWFVKILNKISELERGKE